MIIVSISLTLGGIEVSSGDTIGAFQIVNGELVCVGFSAWTDEDISVSLWEDELATSVIDGYIDTEPLYWIVNQSSSSGVNYLLHITSNPANIITEMTVNTLINLGCTDETAFNYNAAEDVMEDGSCEAIVNGCTDEGACGFDATANTDDGSCYNLTVSITASAENTLTANIESSNTIDVLTNPSYSWTLNNLPTGLGMANENIFQSGTYTVTVTDDLGCNALSTEFTANLSVNEVIDNNIVIYPNPANSVINITSNNSNIHSFDLYNAIGELMLTKSELNSKLITINRNELKSGVYISKISDEDGNTIIRNIIFE